MLEVGLAWVAADGLTIHCRHIIIRDHPDKRDDFNFGVSEYVELCDLNAPT